MKIVYVEIRYGEDSLLFDVKLIPLEHFSRVKYDNFILFLEIQT
jgi:hypothetical protein